MPLVTFKLILFFAIMNINVAGSIKNNVGLVHRQSVGTKDSLPNVIYFALSVDYDGIMAYLAPLTDDLRISSNSSYGISPSCQLIPW